MKSIDVLHKHRALSLRFLDAHSTEELLRIPEGFANNLLWNLGHLVVTQEILTYGFSGLDLHPPERLVAQCRRGTSPADWTEPPDVDTIRRELEASPGRLEKDYAAGRFAAYKSYTTSTGVELSTVEDAIAFNNFHEGLHFGVMMALRKRL